MKDKPKIILFDGICNFCNSSVDFVIEHDKNNLYVFAALQSEIGQKYLEKINLPRNDFDSFVLIDQDEFYTASTAALIVAKDLSGFIRFLYPLIYIPKVVRDSIYKWIAKHRYKVFGKRDRCRVPTQEYKDKFLVNQ